MSKWSWSRQSGFSQDHDFAIQALHGYEDHQRYESTPEYEQDKIRSAPEASVATTPLVFCGGRRFVASSAAESDALTGAHTHLRYGVGVEVALNEVER